MQPEYLQQFDEKSKSIRKKIIKTLLPEVV